jgi:uncharacterized membrane protein HdeD (DUF308 family)
MILHTEILSKIQRVTWLGSALIVLGLLALLSPLIAGKTTVVLIGFILLAAGIVQLTEGFRGGSDRDNRVLTLVLGAITTLAALCVLAHPLLGLRFLTFLFIGYLVGDGLWKIISALRNMTASGRLWLLASGILSLLLGVLIWQQWPVPVDSAAGIIIGLNLVSTGVALLALAGSMKDTLRNAIFALQRRV